MYASQTKRLCVRGASSDETTKVQQQNSLTTDTTTSEATINNQETASKQSTSNRPSTSQSSRSPSSLDMTTSTMPSDSHFPLSMKTPSTHTRINDNDHHKDMTHTSAFAAALAAACLSIDANENDLIEKLSNENLEEVNLEIIMSIRNLITACNKKKNSIVNNRNFTRILDLIEDDRNSNQIKTQVALLLCSIAKAGDYNVEALNKFMVDDKILNLIFTTDDQDSIEACLRCLRAIMSRPRVSRARLIYDSHSIHNNNTGKQKQIVDARTARYSTRLQKIIACAQECNSFVIQECVADILAATCDRRNQATLYKSSAMSCIVKLLESPSYKVVIASLNWLTQMCSKNNMISMEIIETKCPSGMSVIDRLTCLMNKDNCNELQFLSARCFAHIYRAIGNENMKRIDSKITTHVLPTLVRMVHKDKAPHLRIKSAECIAYLIESDTNLQNTASFCDHLIDSLANMLEFKHNSMLVDVKNSSKAVYKCSRVNDRGVTWLSITSCQGPPALDLRPATQLESSNKTSSRIPTTTFDSETSDDIINIICDNHELDQEMKRAAFLALASLASNLETIRTKIFNTCSVMQNLVKSLTDTDTNTLKSVLTCLLSLSRSVQQLRTSFAENSVYSALKNLLCSTPDDVLILVLAILCNISLDFSPGKQHFLDSKTIEILCDLTKRSDPILRLHGMWILMNMVYQMKDLTLKLDIIKTLDMQHALSLLLTEGDEEIVLKALGFLRNLLSQKNHIDNIMSKYGDQIMQTLSQMLQKPYSPKIKEHTLCVLTNIADGPESKALIMENEAILNYLSRIISDEQGGDLRLAAICCICNLAHKDSEGSNKRRDEMKRFGIEEKLKLILDTNDPALSDRVRTAYSYFYS